MAQGLARRYQPTLFVSSQADENGPAANDLVDSCTELLRAGASPQLGVWPAAPAEYPSRRVLVAADREPFWLAPEALLASAAGFAQGQGHCGARVNRRGRG